MFLGVPTSLFLCFLGVSSRFLMFLARFSVFCFFCSAKPPPPWSHCTWSPRSRPARRSCGSGPCDRHHTSLTRFGSREVSRTGDGWSLVLAEQKETHLADHICFLVRRRFGALTPSLPVAPLAIHWAKHQSTRSLSGR